MKGNDTQAHWRDSAITPKFFVVDARGAFAVLIVFFHPNWYTISLMFVVLGFLAFLNYRNLPILVMMRIMKNYLIGSRKILVTQR